MREVKDHYTNSPPKRGAAADPWQLGGRAGDWGGGGRSSEGLQTLGSFQGERVHLVLRVWLLVGYTIGNLFIDMLLGVY